MMRRRGVRVALALALMLMTTGAAARMTGPEDGRTEKHEGLPEGVPPPEATNVRFHAGGCVSWAEEELRAFTGLPIETGTCAPRPPTPWDTGSRPVVAVARLTVQDDGTYRFWSEVAALAPGDYALDAPNGTLHLEFQVAPHKSASAIELVRPGHEPVLLVFSHIAHVIGGDGGVRLPYVHSPGFMLMLTPTMLRWENHFTEGCPSTTEYPGREPFEAEGLIDYVVGDGETRTLRFTGEHGSNCPPATVEVEHLGLWTWKVPERPRP